ncbi:MAG: OpgC domain-containing protein [Candidatus Saccharimonadales bacterium]
MSASKKIPRILTFDLMRGFFLIAIIIDHLYFFPNFLDWWGMRGALLVTTAEGFFMVSGVVLGIVRGAKLNDRSFRDVAKIILKRAWTLYLTHVILVIAFTLLAWYVFNGNPHIKWGAMTDHSLWQLLWQTFSLQYIYGWADYLRYYTIFIALSPLAMWLLRQGRWYIVLLISYTIWFLSPIDHSAMEWELIELLQPIPWQAIFFTGLVIGFHWSAISRWFTVHRNTLVQYIVIPIMTLSIGLFVWNVFSVFAKEFTDAAWATQLSSAAYSLRSNEFNKESLPLVRFTLFMLWFWTAFLLVQRFEKPILRYTGWLLLPFGTNSLYVYTLHAVIVYFVHIYLTSGAVYQNFGVTVAIIAVIYLAIRTKFLMNIIPR